MLAAKVVVLEGDRFTFGTERDEALEHQTATAAILRVIATSPTDRQVVLQTIVDTAARLCGARTVDMYQVIGDTYQGVAAAGFPADPAVQAEWRRIRDGCLLTRESISGRAMLDRKTVYVSDILACGEEYPESFRGMTRIGTRVQVSVPLVSGDRTLGTLNLFDSRPDAFTAEQIRLLETFADQAVIAIENARLFSELEQRNRELSEALDRQTATTDILGLIASSPTDVQPVVDAVAERAARLCRTYYASVVRVEGDVLRVVARYVARPLDRRPTCRPALSTSDSVVSRSRGTHCAGARSSRGEPYTFTTSKHSSSRNSRTVDRLS